jgi:SAM-dependent methyltransferase
MIYRRGIDCDQRTSLPVKRDSCSVNTNNHPSHLCEIYSIRALPVFQNRMFETAEAARNCVKGDVVLVQDLETGLIFNQAFKPELMQYDSAYQNEQAVSAVFRRHLRDVSCIVEKHFAGQSLIEVGCGKGHFLEQLQGIGFDITGLDPTYEGSNASVVKEYFSVHLGLRADGIVLRHVLEHVQDPVAFLCQLRDANGGKGKIYIEVPCFDWICDQRAWFDIFYEHVNYFRLTDFRRMFDVVHESGRTFSGQYLYVVADLATIRKPSYKDAGEFSFPKNFLGTVDQHVRRLEAATKKGSAVWGGASKGVIFSLLMQRAGVKVDVVIDINPAKQGKYLAGTGLKVSSPEQAMDLLLPGADIFVMNRNYLQEIREATADRFTYITVDNANI